MKKFFSLIVGAVFLISFFCSCSALSSDSDLEATGISIVLPAKSIRAAIEMPDWAEEISSYTVSIESINLQAAVQNSQMQIPQIYSQTKEAKAGETVIFDQIPVGRYTVTVIAKNSEFEIIGKGSNTAIVEENKISKVAISIKKYSSSDDSDNSGSIETVIEFEDLVSFENKSYETLSEALNAAANSTAEIANTLKFNGDIKANITDSNYSISQNLIIDLNGHTLTWAAFSSDENAEQENPLFQVNNGTTLVIKNGTITSESKVEHTNFLLGTTGGTIVLSDVAIKEIKAASLININSDGSTKGSLYTSNVKIGDCEVKNSGISVNNSYFYALNTNILDVLSDTASVCISEGTQGSFVGGTITLTSNKTLSSNKEDAALLVTDEYTSFAIASSTIYSNTSSHGVPVIVSKNGILNLADGFKFKKFNVENFEVNSINNDSYIGAEALGLESVGANIIAAFQSTEIKKSEKSKEIAIYIGTAPNAEDSGSLYISGNSAIYGVAKLYLYSMIGQTGKISSDTVIKIDFDNIEIYSNSELGNYPLYWAAGQEFGDNKFEKDKFSIYNNDDYEIEDSGYTVNFYGGNNRGNKIYAPLEE